MTKVKFCGLSRACDIEEANNLCLNTLDLCLHRKAAGMFHPTGHLN